MNIMLTDPKACIPNQRAIILLDHGRYTNASELYPVTSNATKLLVTR